MFEHRQSVREYLRATEALLKIDDLTDAELQALSEMLYHLSEKLLDARQNGKS